MAGTEYVKSLVRRFTDVTTVRKADQLLIIGYCVA
jgi:hypothetical protein